MKTQNDSVYALYLNEIKSYPLLSESEEKSLLKKIASGDEEAKTLFINSNLRLVISIAGRFADSNTPFMDLIQEGNIALMTAVSKFKISFRTRFSTYAYPWILQYMQRYVQTKSTDIYIPDNKIALLRKINEVRAELFAKNGFMPSDADIARVLHVEEKTVRDISVMPWNVIRFDSSSDGYEDTVCGNSIPDTACGPEETAPLSIRCRKKNAESCSAVTISTGWNGGHYLKPAGCSVFPRKPCAKSKSVPCVL